MSAKFLLLKFLFLPRSKSNNGFTLIELLVTFLVGGVVVSGLLLATNELLRTDQRESTLTETQRDLQNALDYMSAELRQAVYVYPNAACLEGNQAPICSTIIDHEKVEPLPSLPGYTGVTATPVLAFWKQTPLSQVHIDACAVPGSDDPPGITCLNGSGYTLVVYAYSENGNGDGPWAEQAGVLRYEMKLPEAGGSEADFGKYVSPLRAGVLNFNSWPEPDPGADIQEAAFAEPEILVDFVDYPRNSQSVARTCPGTPVQYHASPGTSPTDFPDGLGGFYACVNSDAALRGDRNLNDGGDGAALFGYGNQDIIVFLQGNAKGRSGLMTENSFTPKLETHIVLRGALNRTQ